jgi:formylglycine-generating enzyme required for sulfatase activity
MEIQRELQQRAAFMLLMTEHALGSSWVDLEMLNYQWLMAQDRSRMLLPVRIDSCTVPPFLKAFFWIDAQTMPFEQAIDAIATALSHSTMPPMQPSADAAIRLAPNDLTIAQARKELREILIPDRFPPRLAELGFTAQERNGVTCIVPPVCQIPAGEFLIGNDPRHNLAAGGNEQPQHRVNLGAYAISRFPVTVAEYACFVETGQRQPNDWVNQVQKFDHPVVDVSWDDAVVYAAWLAKLTGQPWRLPTEAEWEKAARWDARSGIANLYPWGDSFDPSRANTKESGKRTTTAVGSYPNGVSPYGAEEMAGNVWEWTHSLFRPYPYTASDGREEENATEPRVLRGGSWDGIQEVARAACRVHYWPDDLNLNVGFRLALAAPGSA